MVLELALGLRDRGYEIEVITSSWNNGDFVTRMRCAGLYFVVLPLGFISATISFAAMRMTFSQALKFPSLCVGYWYYLLRKKPRCLIHTNWHHLILLLPFLHREKDFFWVHELLPDKPQYRYLFRILSRLLGGFICVSHAVAASLQRLGIPNSKLFVIHNSVLISPEYLPISPPRTKKTCCRIGIVGQIGVWKGHEDLFEALSFIVDQSYPFELHIFGNGDDDYLDFLNRKADHLGIGKMIVCHGFVHDRINIYRDMDICVVPSRFEEPFGLAALEPGFFSIPVVASRVGGIPEIIENGVNGILFAAGNAQDLANALSLLITNPSLRLNMGACALRLASERFSKDKFLDDFCSFFSSQCSFR